MTDDDTDDPICPDCGEPRSAHDIDERTLEPTKCPVAPGDQGQTVLNNEHRREQKNMERARKAEEIDEPLCAHPFGDPHAAEFMEHTEQGTWIPVCADHVDPTNEVQDIYEHEP